MTTNQSSNTAAAVTAALNPAESSLAPGEALGEVDLLGAAPVWTPEIERLAGAVMAHFRLPFRGMAIDGAQRCGKTQACHFLLETLPQMIGYPVATFFWSIPEFCKTERDFVQERLRDSGCRAVSHRDIAVLRGRLYDHLAETATQLGGRSVIIIVDEAHNLTREQYHYLHHADNNLEKRKIRPFFLLVGQPELRDAPSTWMQSNGHQVVGRFFARQHAYKGVALADLPEVVAGFDEPDGNSNEAAYAKALPDAWRAGWRLKNIAPLLVETITAVANKHNITAGIRVPMQSLRAMLLSALFQLIETRVDPAHFDRRMALKAIRDSAFLTVMEYYVDKKGEADYELDAA